ncbi:uncharacterized protein G2W53_010750 [Senna tora]|uniref:Uncharacterized protein n=1 Tax=Senna tora TaxID=362788 RepID=A0A835CBR8_9FABA|nr:uncharacterized protein G2W53_010750 [Senna tora]
MPLQRGQLIGKLLNYVILQCPFLAQLFQQCPFEGRDPSAYQHFGHLAVLLQRDFSLVNPQCQFRWVAPSVFLHPFGGVDPSIRFLVVLSSNAPSESFFHPQHPLRWVGLPVNLFQLYPSGPSIKMDRSSNQSLLALSVRNGYLDGYVRLRCPFGCADLPVNLFQLCASGTLIRMGRSSNQSLYLVNLDGLVGP